MLLVSPISFWEVGLLVEKGRIRLDHDVFVWTQDLLASDRIDLAPRTPITAQVAAHLPHSGFGGDPAEALIYATAAQALVPLVTKDQRMRLFARQAGSVRAIW